MGMGLPQSGNEYEMYTRETNITTEKTAAVDAVELNPTVAGTIAKNLIDTNNRIKCGTTDSISVPNVNTTKYFDIIFDNAFTDTDYVVTISPKLLTGGLSCGCSDKQSTKMTLWCYSASSGINTPFDWIAVHK